MFAEIFYLLILGCRTRSNYLNIQKICSFGVKYGLFERNIVCTCMYTAFVMQHPEREFIICTSYLEIYNEVSITCTLYTGPVHAPYQLCVLILCCKVLYMYNVSMLIYMYMYVS